MNDADDLEHQALSIAADHLLRGKSLRELAPIYSASASTLHRRLAAWRKEGRFELVDRRSFAARIESRDERLEEELARRTQLWRARVVRINGVDSAASDDYLLGPTTPAAMTAFRAADELHRALGSAAAELFLSSLKRHANVALASGRGVGFTISSLEDAAAQHPSWLRGFETVHIESLCGGGHVGTWATPVTRALDADQNAFALANVLGVGKTNVDFMGGWIASKGNRRLRRNRRIDLALVGLGQLNSRHHFYYHYQEVQLGEMAEPLARIRRLQESDPSLISSIGELGHRLFLVGAGPFPAELQTAVREINEATLSVSPERLTAAGEVILVAGGAQKTHALVQLLSGNCPDAPIDPARVTLVTDSATAAAVLAALKP